MNENLKKLSNSFSTGSGGASFEHAIQAKFVTLMLTGGYAPCLPTWAITEIKLQGKISGYETDDLIVTVESPSNKRRKLLGQIKHSISITEKDSTFAEVIQAAWSDFNNADVFQKGEDVIALITGPISKTDSNSVNFVLEQARHTKDFNEFDMQINQAKFSSNKAREKRDAFRFQLKQVNGNVDVSDNDFYTFLKHFHLLGYDLDKKGSVVSSLLHSHIAQFNKDIPDAIWCQIKNEVQFYNQNAGTITLDNLSDDIKKYFEKPVVTHIPKNLVSINNNSVSTHSTDWINHKSAQQLAFANLIGRWNEKNETDKEIVAKVVGEDYNTWITELRNTLSIHDTPFSFKNGLWSIKDRKQLWSDLGEKIFDNHLDTIKEVILDVLTHNDPVFDLPIENRFAANIYGKVLPHSDNLREGLAQTLALLGNYSNALSNCSTNKAENIAIGTIRDLFDESDWLRWGSLCDILPILSEVSPKFFLEAVESAINTNPSPFDALFEQESAGTFGQNYMTGLLWALENIAWEEEYLTRVSVVLAEIATHDPGGNWENRPINSLSDIFLSWHPQTLASVKKRQIAITTVCNEQPLIGWNLVHSLLPNQHSHTTGTHKPKWRDIVPEDWQPNVSGEEYWEQKRFYTELLVEMAEFDVDKLATLVGDFDKLVQPAFDKLKEKLISEECLALTEEQRTALWNTLIKFISDHRRYTDSDLRIDESFLKSLDVVAKKLAPRDPKLLYQRLFTESDFDLYENNGDFQTESEKIVEKRKQAILEIIDNDGLEGVLNFAWGVSETGVIGKILAQLCIIDSDALFLPSYLETTSSKKWNLMVSYVHERRIHQKDWQWFDDIDKTNWTKKQIAILLSIMPFGELAWNRAIQLLDKDENLYWENTNAFTIGTEDNIDCAIKKLLEVDRPHIALHSIRQYSNSKRKVDINLVCDVLLNLVQSDNLDSSYNTHDITEAIKQLQENPATDQDKLFQIEWAYLNLLGKYSKVYPITLENSLATDPNFFCQLIQMIYKSKNQPTIEKPNETSRIMAKQAHQLLSNWKIVPGVNACAGFDSETFNQWIDEVEKITNNSGHYDVAMIHFGNVLLYAPKGEELWIHSKIAEAMNKKERQKLRDGYNTAIFNSRGAHYVDPEAKPEKEFVKKYRQQANDVENLGYHRLASTLRDIADGYEKEIERILAKK